MNQSNRVVRIAVGVFAALFCCGAAYAGNIELAWSPLSGAAGYRVYHGSNSGAYGQFVDVGASTSANVSGLADCQTHYVAVKAYDGFSESAQFSNEVSGWARPRVTSHTPTSMPQGSQFTLTIDGANFAPGAELISTISSLPQTVQQNDLVRIENVTRLSCTRIQALITVEPMARGQRAMEIGTFAVQFEVVNPDTVFGSRSGSLTVTFNEQRTDINRSDSSTTDRVDGKDLVWLAHSYGASDGQPRYNPDSDLNGDGLVDGDDLVFLAVRFGRCWNGTGWTGQACQ